MRKKWITMFTLASFFIFPLQGHALDTVDAAKINLQANPIEDIVTLPIKGMRAVQSNGQTVLLSDNGRFVFTGQLYDLWYKKPLDTLAEMREVVDRIDLKRMGLDIDTLNTVSLGAGPKQVVVFVDPRCHYCHALMNDAQALVKQYTFKLVAIPVLGEESNQLAKTMSCAKNKKQALKALANQTLDKLPTRSDCSTEQYDRTLLAAQLINIEGVPYVIAPNGRISYGRPLNLKAWLEANS